MRLSTIVELGCQDCIPGSAADSRQCGQGKEVGCASHGTQTATEVAAVQGRRAKALKVQRAQQDSGSVKVGVMRVLAATSPVAALLAEAETRRVLRVDFIQLLPRALR